jgi:ElaA protein
MTDSARDSHESLEWRWKPFTDLTALEVYDMLEARNAVFVVEQRCIYNDVDGLDKDAWHLLAYSRTANKRVPDAGGGAGQADHPSLAGYLRVLLPDASDGDIRIGRVLTVSEFRRIGLGSSMLEQALKHIVAHSTVRFRCGIGEGRSARNLQRTIRKRGLAAFDESEGRVGLGVDRRAVVERFGIDARRRDSGMRRHRLVRVRRLRAGLFDGLCTARLYACTPRARRVPCSGLWNRRHQAASWRVTVGTRFRFDSARAPPPRGRPRNTAKRCR